MSNEQVTNLDQDLHNSRLAKYNNQGLQREVKTWILNILGSQIDQSLFERSELLESLKTGTVLCKLVNAIWGPNTLIFKESSMAFVQMELIERFLNFIKAQGVPQDELFQTVDLYEAADPYQVLMTLQALSRLVKQKFGAKYNLIGPTISTKHERPKVPPKPKKFSASSGVPWSTIEYGYMNGSNQTTEKIVFGARRDIVDRH